MNQLQEYLNNALAFLRKHSFWVELSVCVAVAVGGALWVGRDAFKQAAELGDAKLLPCSMAMDLLKITQNDLDPEFGPPTGLTRFLNDAEGGQLLTF